MKSLAFTGTPSFHTAAFLILTVSVNLPPRRPTFASPSDRSGANEKSGFWMYRPRSVVPTVHAVHVLLHESSAPFRQGGSCSAPKMSVPPFFGPAAVPAKPPDTYAMVASASSAVTASVNRRIVPPLGR